MAIISRIEAAAEEAGITAIITNSDSNIQTQLNRITDEGNLPIMLISWDMTSSAQFDENGFIKNPETPITALLMGKAITAEKKDREEKASEMQSLFFNFIQNLYSNLISINRDTSTPAITGVEAKLVPKYGLGKHSGVICKWNMKSDFNNCYVSGVSSSSKFSGTYGNVFSDSDKSKLQGIEEGADVTDSDNVNPLIDNHINTNVATDNQVLSWDGSNYVWTANVGSMSDSDIKTAYENNADTNAYTDSEKNKLANIELNAKDDQNASEVSFTPVGNTLATNVQAAIEEIQTEVDSIGGGGVTDHGALVGLTDDDHLQYLTEARHDSLPSDNPHGVTAAQVGAETTAQLDIRDTNNRDRSNHTGTQTSSTISDFDTEVSNNTDVVNNTSKLSGIEDNATADQDASEVSVTPSGNLTSSDTQSALEELQIKLDNLTPYTFTGNSVPMDKPTIAYNTASANTFTTYTLSSTLATGAKAIILINTSTTEPVVNFNGGGSVDEVEGDVWVSNTDFELTIEHQGGRTVYYFVRN